MESKKAFLFFRKAKRTRPDVSNNIPSTEELLAELPQPFRNTLLSMYAGEAQIGLNDQAYKLDEVTRIKPEQGICLYRLCREIEPKNVLEIGLAYGFSTLYFLAALSENKEGSHTAIDPYQEMWHGIGLSQPKKVQMIERFRFINDTSVSALTSFAKQKETFDFIFIDGNHKFDDAFMDFALSAQLCPMGGVIIFDDMWMPSIRRAVSFIRKNRLDFEEVKTAESNIAVFRRTGKDSRDWNHYVDF